MSQSWVVFGDDDLTSTQKLVYYCLCRFQGEHEDCFPSHKTIAKQCKIAVSSVKLALASLERKGYISKTPQKRPDGGNSTNRYKCLK
jgi:DNA-binding MarR family transcriptional regulator